MKTKLILCLCMLMLVFAACNSQKSSESDAESTDSMTDTTTNAVTDSLADDQEGEEQEKEYDNPILKKLSEFDEDKTDKEKWYAAICPEVKKHYASLTDDVTDEVGMAIYVMDTLLNTLPCDIMSEMYEHSRMDFNAQNYTKIVATKYLKSVLDKENNKALTTAVQQEQNAWNLMQDLMDDLIQQIYTAVYWYGGSMGPVLEESDRVALVYYRNLDLANQAHVILKNDTTKSCKFEISTFYTKLSSKIKTFYNNEKNSDENKGDEDLMDHLNKINQNTTKLKMLFDNWLTAREKVARLLPNEKKVKYENLTKCLLKKLPPLFTSEL